MDLIALHPYISGSRGLQQDLEYTLLRKSVNGTLVLTEPVCALTKHVATNCPE